MPGPSAALLPVALLMGCGWLAGRWRWIDAPHLPGLANVVFLMLSPALLFRTMSQVGFGGLDFRPTVAYLIVAFLLFVGIARLLGGNKRGVVIGLASIFSNTVMVGVPLVTFAYGHDGLVTLLTLISVHALTLLTAATFYFEWLRAREEAAAQPDRRHAALADLSRIVLRAARRSLLHPVPLPIIVGVLWGLTGLRLPEFVDQSLKLLGAANGPLSLVLVGATLAHTTIGRAWRGACVISVVKNLLMPLLVGLAAWGAGVRGVPLAVITVAAGLPVGSNVYLFSHRYGEAQTLVTATLAFSTLASLATLALVMQVVDRLAG